MPRGRMLNKKISFDEKVANLSLKAALFYTWCIPNLDVKGRILADPVYLRGVVVPYRKIFTPRNIQHCINEMIKNDLVIVYGDSRKYMEFKGFTRNQDVREDREAKSEIPDPTPDQLKSNSGETPAQYNISKVNTSKDMVEVAQATFDYYIDLFKKNKSQYQYTTKRKNKLQQRARELFHITQDIDKTKELMLLAIKNRKASNFHMGDNPQGKKYIDLVDHIFRSQEYTEQLIFEEKPKYTEKRAEWMDDLAKKYEERTKKKIAESG